MMTRILEKDGKTMKVCGEFDNCGGMKITCITPYGNAEYEWLRNKASIFWDEPYRIKGNKEIYNYVAQFELPAFGLLWYSRKGGAIRDWFERD